MLPQLFYPYARGSPAVECKCINLRETLQQADEIIFLPVADLAIQAARSICVRDDIPQTDAVTSQRFQPGLIRKSDHFDADHLSDKTPKSILTITIIFLER